MLSHLYAYVVALHLVGHSGRCARAKEGVEHKIPRVCCYVQYPLQEALGLWRGKDIRAKERQYLLLGLIRMPSLRVGSEISGDPSAYLFEIGLATNASLAPTGEVEAGPPAALVDSLCHG